MGYSATIACYPDSEWISISSDKASAISEKYFLGIPLKLWKTNYDFILKLLIPIKHILRSSYIYTVLLKYFRWWWWCWWWCCCCCWWWWIWCRRRSRKRRRRRRAKKCYIVFVMDCSWNYTYKLSNCFSFFEKVSFNSGLERINSWSLLPAAILVNSGDNWSFKWRSRSGTCFDINAVRYYRAWPFNTGEEQHFVADSMLHGKSVQFFQHGAYMFKLVPFRYNPGCIILAALQSVYVELFCYL